MILCFSTVAYSKDSSAVLFKFPRVTVDFEYTGLGWYSQSGMISRSWWDYHDSIGFHHWMIECFFLSMGVSVRPPTWSIDLSYYHSVLSSYFYSTYHSSPLRPVRGLFSYSFRAISVSLLPCNLKRSFSITVLASFSTKTIPRICPFSFSFCPYRAKASRNLWRTYLSWYLLWWGLRSW